MRASPTDPTRRTPTRVSVLFVCTGNYYRSRIAEAVFNHRAASLQTSLSARSAGLAVHLIDVPSMGGLSPHARQALAAEGIDVSHTGLLPTPFAADLAESAERVIALYDAEHRPMVEDLHPGLASYFTYWDIPDVPHWPPARAVARIFERVDTLLDELTKR